MGAPEHVPVRPAQRVRSYASPPRRPDSWMADRPADLLGGQPSGDRLGVPGPDQGYALRLVHGFRDEVHLGALAWDDVVAGCVAVALKRAALFGRAPVKHDLTVAFTVWGFLSAAAPAELVALREELFPEVASSHHYPERRAIADAVPDDTLRMTPALVGERHGADWRSLLHLAHLPTH